MWELEIDGVRLGPTQFGKPSGVRVGYRGPTLGSREAGSADFTVFHPEDPARPSYCQRGRIVDLFHGGLRMYRGVIAQVTDLRYATQLGTREPASRLSEIEAGMPTVNFQANPDGYVYYDDSTEWTIAGRRQHPFTIRTEGSFTTDPLYYTQLTRDWLFDSYEYLGQGSSAIARRSILHTELTLTEIAERVRDQANALYPGLIMGIDVQLSGVRNQLTRPLHTPDEQFVHQIWNEPEQRQFSGGLLTRTIFGRRYSFAWIETGEEIRLYQLTNHSRAVPLGRIPVVYDPSWEGMWVSPEVSGRPEAVFYRLFILAHQFGYETRAEVWIVPLSYPRTLEAEDELVHEVTERYGDSNIADGPAAYLQWDPAQNDYRLTTVPNARRHTDSFRSDGRYAVNANGIVEWNGNILLEEHAIDFRGGKLSDVLHELTIASGAEWWVDSGGVLRVERVDRPVRTENINGIILSDIPTERDAEQAEDVSFSGIETNEIYTRLMNRELKALAGEHQAVRRDILIAPHLPTVPALGARLRLNGTEGGRIVAYEPRGETLFLETESAPAAAPPERLEIEITLDTYLRADLPTSNFGTLNTLFVRQGILAQLRRILLKADLSSLPVRARLRLAELWARTLGSAGAEGYVEARPVLQNWTETGATWNTYDGSNAWTAAGGDYGDASDTQEIMLAGGGSWRKWNVKTIIEGQRAGQNFGILLKFADESDLSTLQRGFTSGEGSSRPKLVLEFDL